MKASVVDLRYRMKDVLKALDRGETVTVLYRGKEKARLTPIAGEIKERLVCQRAFGMWKDRADLKDVPAYVRQLRRGRFDDL
ncbi:MAG: type II toxin-antitoxin system Phd/YefM family antitoxin [Bryobacteraceae bacterium]|jgi:antitoxin (DNA-binding transcriptional repressor) of toxin-antitoxin stability system